MTFTVIVEADAERDWDKAVMWYDEREPGSVIGSMLRFAQSFTNFPGSRNDFFAPPG